MGLLLETVEFDFGSVNPGRRDGVAANSLAKSNDAMEPTVLVEREQRLRVGLQSMAKLGELPGLRVVTELPFVAEWPADAARPLNQKLGGDAQGAAALVDLFSGGIARMDVA